MNYIMKIVLLTAILGSRNIIEAYRILSVMPIPSGSHAILGDACVKTLLDAGHEVVYVTALPNRLQAHPKLVEVDVSSIAKYSPTNVLNLTELLNDATQPTHALDFLYKATAYCVKIVKHEAVQRVLNEGKKFDLVIAEWMFSEIYAGLPALFDCPLIWFSSMEPHSMILDLIDEELNPVYTADFGETHVAPFTFFQKVKRLSVRWILQAYRLYYIYFKETNEFYNLYEPMMKKFGKDLASYHDLRYNASLVLGNSHVSLGQATRLPQNYIPIGGYHIDPEKKPLSEDLKRIMDSATNGVIYFSMGSILKSKDYPQKLKMELLNMLGSLNHTVLWKFEEDFTNIPNNVHILKWVSQQSVLSHPNCALFISHGGLLSLTESIHYAVPLIGVPVFGDQFVNIMVAEQKGVARKVDLSYDLAKDLKDAIIEVMGNPQFNENAKAVSFVYHDRPVHPRKELVHWVEHVIKTQGAPLLKSPALKVPIYQKMYLDLAIVILISFYLLISVVKHYACKFSMKIHLTDGSLKTKKLR